MDPIVPKGCSTNCSSYGRYRKGSEDALTAPRLKPPQAAAVPETDRMMSLLGNLGTAAQLAF